MVGTSFAAILVTGGCLPFVVCAADLQTYLKTSIAITTPPSPVFSNATSKAPLPTSSDLFLSSPEPLNSSTTTPNNASSTFTYVSPSYFPPWGPGRVRPEWVEDYEAKFGRGVLGNRWKTITPFPWSPILTDPVYHDTKVNPDYHNGPMTDYTAPQPFTSFTNQGELIASLKKNLPSIITKPYRVHVRPPWDPIFAFKDIADENDPYEVLWGPRAPEGSPQPHESHFDLEALETFDVMWETLPSRPFGLRPTSAPTTTQDSGHPDLHVRLLVVPGLMEKYADMSRTYSELAAFPTPTAFKEVMSIGASETPSPESDNTVVKRSAETIKDKAGRQNVGPTKRFKSLYKEYGDTRFRIIAESLRTNGVNEVLPPITPTGPMPSQEETPMPEGPAPPIHDYYKGDWPPNVSDWVKPWPWENEADKHKYTLETDDLEKAKTAYLTKLAAMASKFRYEETHSYTALASATAAPTAPTGAKKGVFDEVVSDLMGQYVTVTRTTLETRLQGAPTSTRTGVFTETGAAEGGPFLKGLHDLIAEFVDPAFRPY